MFTTLNSSFLKTDFRLENDIYCCSDDYDYYSHAKTIALDFDFDYQNQFNQYLDARFYKNEKAAPIGFVGSGLLASPFVFIGNIFDKILNVNSFVNYKILFYSFSSVFYLFTSFYFLIKIKNMISPKFKNIHLLFLLLGSGVSYYAFERFSMTHVYEVFTITMISYFTLKPVSKNTTEEKLNIFYITFFMFLGFNVRWVNYFLMILPFFLTRYLNINNKEIYKNKVFYFFSAVFLFLTLYINKLIYGVWTLNPNFVYSSGITDTGISLFFNIPHLVKSFFIILFSQEFGILYFSPIIFSGFFISIYRALIGYKKIFSFVGLAIFLQVFSIVILWQSTSSSYGFRYLNCLIPISIIMFLHFYENMKIIKYKEVILKIIIFLSIFSFLSTLFFETTLMTQLSLEEQINSFGKSVRYTEPEYLKGYLLSIFELEAYLKIFVTSFLGMVFFNLLFYFTSPEKMLNFLDVQFGLNLKNEKVNNLLLDYQELNYLYILIVMSLILFIYSFLKKSAIKN